MPSYAEYFGYRPATRAEKLARGFKPSTRAYTPLDGGRVISHRALQTMGLRENYGEGIDPRNALEERARLRREELGVANPRSTFDKMVRKFATAPVKQGGLGAKFDKRTREYVLRDGERLTFQEVAASPSFRDQEVGSWSQWQRIRHARGPRGQRMRFNFLRRLGMFKLIRGKWKYVG